MAVINSESYFLFEQLKEIGFGAGTTFKGAWPDHDSVYRFIEENLIPPGMKLIIPLQVHGSEIVNLDGRSFQAGFEADGAITSRSDLCLTVTTADCIPLLLADPISGYMAAVHIGWRSLAGGIIENLIRMARDLGINFEKTRVMLGPAIGKCCFEVGPEVAALFEDRYIITGDNSSYFDLREAVWNKLLSLGVAKTNMGGLIDCTYCEKDRYYSYRRDKQTPVQMVTFIFKST